MRGRGRRPYGRSHEQCSGRRHDTSDAWAHGRRITAGWSSSSGAWPCSRLGALAPFADRALSGAGWEAPGSESGEARRAIESRFPGQGTYALSVVVAGREGMAIGRCAPRSPACGACCATTGP